MTGLICADMVKITVEMFCLIGIFFSFGIVYWTLKHIQCSTSSGIHLEQTVISGF